MSWNQESFEVDAQTAWARGSSLLGRLGAFDESFSSVNPEIWSVQALAAIVRSVVVQSRVRHSRLRLAQIELILPSEIEPGARVRFDAKALSSSLSALVDRSVSSLGGGIGVVRARLSIGMGSVNLTIEDNGRGFSDDLIRHTIAKGGYATGSESVLAAERIRRLAHAWGGRAESLARLGAGSRTDIELPRSDHSAFVRQS